MEMFTSYPVSMLFCRLMNSSGMHGRICNLTKFSESWNAKEPPFLAEIFQEKKIIFIPDLYILDVSDVAVMYFKILKISEAYLAIVRKMYHLAGYYGFGPICILPAPRQTLWGFSEFFVK